MVNTKLNTVFTLTFYKSRTVGLLISYYYVFKSITSTNVMLYGKTFPVKSFKRGTTHHKKSAHLHRSHMEDKSF